MEHVLCLLIFLLSGWLPYYKKPYIKFFGFPPCVCVLLKPLYGLLMALQIYATKTNFQQMFHVMPDIGSSSPSQTGSLSYKLYILGHIVGMHLLSFYFVLNRETIGRMVLVMNYFHKNCRISTRQDDILVNVLLIIMILCSCCIPLFIIPAVFTIYYVDYNYIIFITLFTQLGPCARTFFFTRLYSTFANAYSKVRKAFLKDLADLPLKSHSMVMKSLSENLLVVKDYEEMFYDKFYKAILLHLFLVVFVAFSSLFNSLTGMLFFHRTVNNCLNCVVGMTQVFIYCLNPDSVYRQVRITR